MNDITIRDYQKSDAKKLMRMWRETAHLWPMGAPYPTEISVDEFNKRLRGSGALKHWVAIDNTIDRIVGYCAFAQDTVIPEHMEVSLVNMHPEWQGRGIGKALLIKCIERTADMKSPALFLGTWPGNEKACGLYKRLGFFHEPETDIDFVNFIPSILNCPLLNGHINKSNWYSSLKRDTSYGPDKFSDGKMKVYSYRFETDTGIIEVGFERFSQGLYSVKTPDIQVSLKADYDKGWKGFSREFELSVQSSSKFSAKISGAHGLNLAQTIRNEKNKQNFKHKFPVQVPENLALKQPISPCINVVLSNAEQEIAELKCGFDPVEPVAATILNYHAFITAGAGAKRILNLKNNLDENIKAKVELDCPGKRSVTPSQFEVTLESGRTKGLEIMIDGEPGSCKLNCKSKILSGKRGKLPDQLIPIGVVAPDKPAWIEDENKILVASTYYFFGLSKKRGVMTFKPRIDDRCSIGLIPVAAGPPYPSFGLDGNAEIALKEVGNSIEIRMETPSRQFKGLKAIQIFRLNSSPMISVDAWLETECDHGKGIMFRQQVLEPSFLRTTVLPVDNDFLRLIPIGPDTCIDNLPKNGLLSKEAWIAIEGENAVAGCIWANKPEEMEFGSFNAATITKSADTLKPGQRLEMERIWFYAGSGDSRTIRDSWLQFQDRKSENPKERKLADDPRKAVIFKLDKSEIKLNINTLLSKSEDVTLKIKSSTELQVSAQKICIPKVSANAPGKVALQVDNNNLEPGISLLKGSISRQQWEIPFQIPVISATNNRVKLSTSKKGKFTIHSIEQGPINIDVAPGYPGQIISMRWNGIEGLHSMFPGSGVLGFEKPYYGGITPTLQSGYSGGIHWASGRASKSEFTDEFGLTWHGIKVRSKVTKDIELKDSVLTCHYLLSPELPVLKVILNLVNLCASQVSSMLMGIISPYVPSKSDSMFLRYSQNNRSISYKRGIIGAGLYFDNWFSIEYGKNRPDFHALIQDHTCSSNIIDTGQGQLYCYSANNSDLNPGETRQLTFMIGFDGCGQGLKHLRM